MSLNCYKEEARDFLERINASSEKLTQKMKFLEEEFGLLKDSIETNEVNKIKHQIYDMLFLLFEISADYDFDLDSEWNIGRERKQKKYIVNGAE